MEMHNIALQLLEGLFHLFIYIGHASSCGLFSADIAESIYGGWRDLVKEIRALDKKV